MRIEKLNDKQIKFILSKKDLHSRNIKLDELAYGSDKARGFFKDIMQEAYEKYGFDANNVPLMIEAVPSSDQDITIVVTKVNDKSKGESQVKKGPKIDHKRPVKSPYMIYTFKSLDDVTNLAARLRGVYFGTNSLYKYKDEYYLLLHKNGVHRKSYAHIRAILLEYGTYKPSTSLSRNFLIEHAEHIVENDAIEILGKFMN